MSREAGDYEGSERMSHCYTKEKKKKKQKIDGTQEGRWKGKTNGTNDEKALQKTPERGTK